MEPFAMPAPGPRNYLLAIDGSVHANRAAEYVARRAAKLGPCQVHLVDVHAVLVPGAVDHRDLLAEAEVETAVARRLLDAAGIAYQFHAEFGDPANRIVERARSGACQEVVVGSRGMGALGNLALGSVAYKIVHLSTVPVTVVPNPFGAAGLDLEDGEGVHRILLAVDGSEPSAKAVEYVCALRQSAVPVQVRLLNVQIFMASGNVRRFISQEAIDAYCQAEGEAALTPARKALQAAGLSCDEVVVTGHVAQTIVKEAMQSGCTRIVMGTRGHGAIANIFVGSSALQVMHLSEIPVTMVK
jgi:nucleotide-binding universal stress UspA family protein